MVWIGRTRTVRTIGENKWGLKNISHIQWITLLHWILIQKDCIFHDLIRFVITTLFYFILLFWFVTINLNWIQMEDFNNLLLSSTRWQFGVNKMSNPSKKHLKKGRVVWASSWASCPNLKRKVRPVVHFIPNIRFHPREHSPNYLFPSFSLSFFFIHFLIN